LNKSVITFVQKQHLSTNSRFLHVKYKLLKLDRSYWSLKIVSVEKLTSEKTSRRGNIRRLNIVNLYMLKSIFLKASRHKNLLAKRPAISPNLSI